MSRVSRRVRSARTAWSGVLIRLAGRRGRTDNDRGAVAALVSILLAGGVLLGAAALVIDVGQIYVEREELQSGADAAAVGVARACATGQGGCDTVEAIRDVAQRYANSNASDRISRVVEVCGRLADLLGDCAPPVGNLTDCIGGVPPAPTPYVEVRLGTELPDSRFVLPPTFSQTLSGNEKFAGASVGACARATWRAGAPHILALTISACEFAQATDHGTSYAPAPPYPPAPSPADEYVLGFGEGEEGGCGSPVGDGFWREAGPAGFLDPVDASCGVHLSGDGQAWGDHLGPPTYLPPAGCLDALSQARATRAVVYLPVHDAIHAGVRDGVAATLFREVSVAPFVVTGFSFGTERNTRTSATSWLRTPPTIPCHAEENHASQCVSGVFVGPPVPLVGLAGTAIVRLIG
jgi:hypothetical protein